MKRLHRFGYVMLGELATTRHFYAIHRAIYRLSGGRIFSRSLGCAVVLLTTTGRKSGEPRTAPIFEFEEGQSVVVVPSNTGKEHFPAWYFNLRANPLAKVQLESEIRTVRAREASLAKSESASGHVSLPATAATKCTVSASASIRLENISRLLGEPN